MLKRLLSMLVLLLFAQMLFVPTAAAHFATVIAEETFAVAGDAIMIPLEIKGNTGIMGFGLTVKYPTEILSSPSASSGCVIPEGMFNDGISAQTNGEFDIIWNGRESVFEDGTLVMLGFRVNPDAPLGSFEIGISVDQANTFDKNWVDVSFDCHNATVTVVSAGELESVCGSSRAGSAEEYINAVSSRVDGGFLSSLIYMTLGSLGNSKITALSHGQLELLADAVSDGIVKYGIQTKAPPLLSDAEAAKMYGEIYARAVAHDYARETISLLTPQSIADAVDKELEKRGVSEIAALESSKKADFALDVLSTLEERGAPKGALARELGTDAVLGAVESVYERALKLLREREILAAEQATVTNLKPDALRARSDFNVVMVCVATTFSILTLGICVALVIKKRRKG